MYLFLYIGLGLVSFSSLSHGQQMASTTQEEHLKFSIGVCNAGDNGNCRKEAASIVMDSNWRWLHKVGDWVNCYTGDSWDSGLCPNPSTCNSNCALDGIDTATWGSAYGVYSWDQSDSSGISLNLVTGGNVGSRTYLLDTDDRNYRMFKLKNREFSMDVNVAEIGCGLNGAVYFVEMDRDGGMSKYSNNKCGSNYGTGYCDAQCPHDMKFINGEANCENWNNGGGKYGACCYEMDIWEANSMAASYTPHDCRVSGYYRCEGVECGDNDSGDRYNGVCDKDGCDWAAYRLGNHEFYGPGSQYVLDSTQEFTVVTQFLTSDGTDNGDLVEIRRKYVQNGQVIENPYTQFIEDGISPYDSVTDYYCEDIKEYFGDINDFNLKGGLKAMGDALDRGMVLTLSLWDDHASYMHWLDSQYPEDEPVDTPGVLRGPCPVSGGHPDDVEANQPDAVVKFFNIKYGPIDSTYPH